MDSFFAHHDAVAASLPNSGHSLLSMTAIYPADIPYPSQELSQLKLNPLLDPRQLQLRHRLNKISEAFNTTLLVFYPPRIRRHLWLIEYPAQSTQVRKFPYRCDRCWSVTSLFLPGSPSIPAVDPLATSVQYPPIMHSASPPVNDMSAKDVSEAEASEHGQRLIDSWVGDAKTVLKFVSPI
jgi:hypothetical protein